MDINQLEVLVAVANEKSFSRAADLLNRTQPAVSQAIRRLELEIGEQLFDRSSKDGTLTAAGDVLLEYARQMLNLRRDAQNAVKELRDLRFGKLTLSANEHTVFALLPIITQFRHQNPNIKIEVRRGVASRIPTEVLGRETEIGAVSFKPDDSAVKSVAVALDELVMIVAPNHALAGKKSVSVRELGVESFIAHNAPSPYREKVLETFGKSKTPLNIVLELPSLEAIKRLVEENVGVALVPRLTAQTEIERGQVVALSVKEMKLERRLHLIYRKSSALSHAAQAFLQIAKGLRQNSLSSETDS
ncbi:MAG: LysR family transcriptional regulator [Pyrinomonadaceae bacterium]|nr:LysR family transcriptional regulator [Pyrinomonadaceae bacterium]